MENISSNGNGVKGKLGEIYSTFGEAVLLPIPLGKKRPVFKGWPSLTYPATQNPEYQKLLTQSSAKGNLGILLGHASNDLRAIDCDSDEWLEWCLGRLPFLRGTIISRGAHGGQIWMRLRGAPDKRIVLFRGEGDKPTMEYRGGGGHQSVIHGKHPEGMRYRYEGEKLYEGHWSDIQEVVEQCNRDAAGQEQDAGSADERRDSADDLAWLGKNLRGCDLDNLDLVGLSRESGLTLTKREGKSNPEEYSLKCPWIDDHSKEQKTTGPRDAEIFQWPIGSRWPAFYCFHGHCHKRNRIVVAVDSRTSREEY
jgi:hypothetical protein